MTRFPHDQFAKEYLKELLAPLGEVETSRDKTSRKSQIAIKIMKTLVVGIKPTNKQLDRDA